MRIEELFDTPVAEKIAPVIMVGERGTRTSLRSKSAAMSSRP